MEKKLSTIEFIEKAKLVHRDKYDYSLVKYINSTTKIKIICREHGEFEQRLYDHLNGSGCFKCSIENRIIKRTKSIEEFINDANRIHGNKYIYDKFNYVHGKIGGLITCPIHGDFKQTSNIHLNGHGCPKCALISGANFHRGTTKNFIEKANLIHNNKYDYSLVDYKNSKLNVKIICSKHGVFEQIANSHSSGQGCPKCGMENTIKGISLSQNEFIERVSKKHNNEYDYSKTIYRGARIKVTIICPKHGEFKQRPFDHLNGCGCPKCSESIGERKIRNFLEINNFNYVREKSFKECRNLIRLSFDFYLPEYNILIEYDGIQHFEPIDYFGGMKSFILQQKRDRIKTEFAKANDMKLIRIAYNENVEEKLNEMLELIKTLELELVI
jgi:very-short-patch-repair endonuclease